MRPPGLRSSFRLSRRAVPWSCRSPTGGPGIPPGDLERIFDKFYRVEAADNRRVGTGLGLAICRGFVEAMGGTITAGNRSDGPGAVFTIAFRIPLQETLLEEAAE
jgi:two-component system sensor histidine kinase KdpD